MPPSECAGDDDLLVVISVWELNNSGRGPLLATAADRICNEASEARDALALCTNAPSPFEYSGLEGAVKGCRRGCGRKLSRGERKTGRGGFVISSKSGLEKELWSGLPAEYAVSLVPGQLFLGGGSSEETLRGEDTSNVDGNALLPRRELHAFIALARQLVLTLANVAAVSDSFSLPA